MGEKILPKKCNGAEDDNNPSQFKTINELKAYIKILPYGQNIKEEATSNQ